MPAAKASKALFLGIFLSFSTPTLADDISAAGRGVVRMIVMAEDGYSESLSLGTGFAVSPHRIVTNAHIVQDADSSYVSALVLVVPSEGRAALPGRIVAVDYTRDLALIAVDDARLEPLTVYSGPVQDGADAAALGYPGNVDFATARSASDFIAPTAPVRSEGSISSQREVNGTPAYLHTANIARGNSGGPLVDDCGRVVGVNTYVTSSGSGDAPFGFAIIGQEVMSFLREHGEKFQQIGTSCVTMAEHAAQMRRLQESAERQATAARNQKAERLARAADLQEKKSQQSWENHIGSALLASGIALLAGILTAVFLVKDRVRSSWAAGAVTTLAVAGAAYAFVTRPNRAEIQPPVEDAEFQPISLKGNVICRVQPDRSRVTVSSTDDLEIHWDASGCLNEQTQYVDANGRWVRVLVPNGSETVSVQEFSPNEGSFSSARYMLPQAEMERIRKMRAADTAGGCTSDPREIQQISSTMHQLIDSLPPEPNEKLVYHCESI